MACAVTRISPAADGTTSRTGPGSGRRRAAYSPAEHVATSTRPASSSRRTAGTGAAATASRTGSPAGHREHRPRRPGRRRTARARGRRAARRAPDVRGVHLDVQERRQRPGRARAGEPGGDAGAQRGHIGMRVEHHDVLDDPHRPRHGEHPRPAVPAGARLADPGEQARPARGVPEDGRRVGQVGGGQPLPPPRGEPRAVEVADRAGHEARVAVPHRHDEDPGRRRPPSSCTHSHAVPVHTGSGAAPDRSARTPSNRHDRQVRRPVEPRGGGPVRAAAADDHQPLGRRWRRGTGHGTGRRRPRAGRAAPGPARRDQCCQPGSPVARTTEPTAIRPSSTRV